MMKPYMGAYGIMKKLLEQPCNLELQIYWETHGLLRLESKQWGYNASGVKDWVVTYPLSFGKNGIPLVSKVGSSANNTEIALIGNKNNLEIHQSEAITILQGIYWIAIGQ